MRNFWTILCVLLVVFVLVLSSVMFQVRTTEKVIVTRFGKPVRTIEEPRYFPYFKYPRPPRMCFQERQTQKYTNPRFDMLAMYRCFPHWTSYNCWIRGWMSGRRLVDSLWSQTNQTSSRSNSISNSRLGFVTTIRITGQGSGLRFSVTLHIRQRSKYQFPQPPLLLMPRVFDRRRWEMIWHW